MPELLANPPWYIPIVLAGLALVLLFQGNSRQNKNLKLAGLGLAALAVAIIAIGHLIESDSEKVARQTNEFVTAVDKRDWAKVEALLDPQVEFKDVPFFKGKMLFVAAAKKSLERVTVKDITVGGLETRPDAGAYLVDFTATADIQEAGRRTPTNWRFLWVKEENGDKYLLYRIEHVPNPEFGSDVVLSRLAKP